MNKWVLLVVSVGLGVLSVYAQNQYELSTVTIRVTDQSGLPITNAFVGINGYTQRSFEGRSDANGRFIYTDRIAGGVSCFVYKDGYYETGGQIWVGPIKWTDHPASEYIVVLKKIVNPAPLVFRRIDSLLMPVLNVPIPFDMEVGDWVQPYGNGKNNDIWIKGEKQRRERRDYDMTVMISFSNSIDGIQEFISPDPNDINTVASELIPLQNSPISGYTNSIIVFHNRHPGHPTNKSWLKNRNYCFRVRTKTNESNTIVASNVGWIHKDISLGVGEGEKVGIMFEYYFNPNPHSRSLEPKEIADRQRKCPVK